MSSSLYCKLRVKFTTAVQALSDFIGKIIQTLSSLDQILYILMKIGSRRQKVLKLLSVGIFHFAFFSVIDDEFLLSIELLLHYEYHT